MLNVTEAVILSWADREAYFAAIADAEPADDLATRRQRVLEAGGGVD